jgi:hypothetical protein
LFIIHLTSFSISA